MDWLQVLAIIGGNLGIIIPLFLWVRSEGNSDRRETQSILREDRKDMLGMISAIHTEMKDFHARLVEIERGRK
jgi:hypothetical protein